MKKHKDHWPKGWLKTRNGIQISIPKALRMSMEQHPNIQEPKPEMPTNRLLRIRKCKPGGKYKFRLTTKIQNPCY